MKYSLGNSRRIRAEGETVEITCPKCSKKVNFSIFTNLNTDVVAKFPVLKFNNVYFAVCPNCSSAFAIDEAQGKEFKKGEKLAIGDFDLKELTPFEV